MKSSFSFDETPLTATTARRYAKEILTKCSQCFSNVRARKFLGKWCVDINGGSGCCYGKTTQTVEGAEEMIRIFGN